MHITDIIHLYSIDTHIIQWLKHRFDDLLLHQVCYNTDITIATLQQQMITLNVTTNEALLTTDRFGTMNPLHILICNTNNANTDLIQIVMDLDPTMSTTMVNMYGATPIDLCVQLQGFNVENGAFSLKYAVKHGMSWNIISKLNFQ